MPPHTCLAGCGKRITWRFAICAECEKTYGRGPTEWPQWLAFLWRDEQRIRRQHRRIVAHEINLSEIDDECNDGESNG